LTAMRTGVYAILAVVVGVMLVGLLPGQLLNFAAPAVVQTDKVQSGAAPEFKLNGTSTNDGSGSSNLTIGTTVTRGKTSINTTTSADTTDVSRTNYDPYNDLRYYALWGVGLIVAFSMYLISKRMLG
jgi:hypothetical protein